jgi:hypothetical protein
MLAKIAVRATAKTGALATDILPESRKGAFVVVHEPQAAYLAANVPSSINRGYPYSINSTKQSSTN